MRSFRPRWSSRWLGCSSLPGPRLMVARPRQGAAPDLTSSCRRPFSNSPRRQSEEERQWSTPLAKQLGEAIATTGPVPLASYMRMCLTSDVGGYYTGAIDEPGRDQFGRKGDFITSPEISQVFGELVGIWFVAEWMAQGRPARGVEVIEVGPGRGTLMDDMLRTFQRFGDLAHAIDAIYLVEASPELRLAQKRLLCGDDAPMTESKSGYHSVCKYTSLPIVWTEGIRSIPTDPTKMPLIIAHEFFDSLPIHAFQSVEVAPAAPDETSRPPSDPHTPTASRSRKAEKHQWRELVVSPTPPGSTHASLKTPRSLDHTTPPPDFQLTLSDAPTRHALSLPESSARYRALRPRPGSVIEVSPDSALYASEFAARIGGSTRHPKPRPSGAALVLDYGPGDGSVPANSLRGISRHRRVSPFAEPGRTDLSVDVDFAALAEAATRASEGVEVHGPVEQAEFLEMMGIRERAGMLVKALNNSNSRNTTGKTGGGGGGGGGQDGNGKAQDAERAWKRLVDRGPGGMGKLYKALAMLPENGGRRRPVGFGGDVPT